MWLRFTETNFQPDPAYMQRQSYILPNHREILVNWLIYVQALLKLLPETLFITVNIIDRFLSKRELQSEKMLQLLGGSAMLIACKFQEINPPTLSDFVAVMQGAWSGPDMLRMETKILSVLQFDLNYTPPSVFVENYSRAIHMSDPIVLVYTSFLLDVALLRLDFLRYRQSELVICAMQLAFEQVRTLQDGQGHSFATEMAHLGVVIDREGFNIQKLNSCRERLDHHRRNEHIAPHPSILKKYKATGLIQQPT